MQVLTIVLALIIQAGTFNGSNPCSSGTKVADDCLGVSDAGCCTGDNSVRWCEGGVLCEASCASTPACGWKSSAGAYGCGTAPKGDPSCEHPYSCFSDGCARADAQAGCCGCECEDCVCAADPFCCAQSWDPICVEKCHECDGCGSKDGCTPSSTPGCAGCACELCVCELDSFCCTNKWDSICAALCFEQCEDPGCQPCVPNCAGKECGGDGCGGKCGVCLGGWECEGSQCVPPPCQPNCAGKDCGNGGCLEEPDACGVCPGDHLCNVFGKCYPPPCEPDCTGVECGSDGCGGSCGVCPENTGCVDGACVEGVCVPSCDKKECGPDGCGWFCGFCPPGSTCDEASGKCKTYCPPNCTGKMCGDDGCGGSCGECAAGLSCNDAGQCTPPCFPACQGKMCGTDYCCGSCGTCADGMVCQDPPGICVMPEQCPSNCAGKECGDDGCGGDCGECPMNWYCQNGMCVPQCSPQCLVPPTYMAYKQCGWDECPGVDGECMGQGVCGACPPGFYCSTGYICVEDTCSCVGVECGPPSDGCPVCGDGPNNGCEEGLSCDMEIDIDPETNVCEMCQPNCLKDDGTPKQCGGDGCGGECGQPCMPGFACDEDPNDGDVYYFQCEPCVPNCINSFGMIKECGPDSCGNINGCGMCPEGVVCVDEPESPLDGTCVACDASCMVPPAGVVPMECGPKDCPAGCLEAGLGPCQKDSDCDQALGQLCNATTHQCVQCESCGTCPVGWICDTSLDDGDEIYVCEPCVPNCSGKECGDNGCGGMCGICPAPLVCNEAAGFVCDAVCEPTANCFGKQCGPTGCGDCNSDGLCFGGCLV